MDNVITPMLAIQGAASALDFYKEVFGATEVTRMTDEEGKIAHAEILVNGAPIMIADEYPEHNRAPQTLGGSSVILHLIVEDADEVVKKAVAAGAKLIRAVADQQHGHRNGKVEDPFGHIWMISSPMKNGTP